MTKVDTLKKEGRKLAAAHRHDLGQFKTWKSENRKPQYNAHCSKCDAQVIIYPFGNGYDFYSSGTGKAHKEDCAGVHNVETIRPWQIERVGPLEPNDCPLHQECTYVYSVVYVIDPEMGDQSDQICICDCPSRDAAEQIVSEHNAAIAK